MALPFKWFSGIIILKPSACFSHFNLVFDPSILILVPFFGLIDVTIISDGIRRWNFEQPKLIQQVKSRGLDCKITIDTSPFTQKEAKYFLSQLMAFVSENPSEFGLNFATEFNKVRDITSGKWNSNLSKTFELFRGYIDEFPLFQKYLVTD